jgi:hypothetical protein
VRCRRKVAARRPLNLAEGCEKRSCYGFRPCKSVPSELLLRTLAASRFSGAPRKVPMSGLFLVPDHAIGTMAPTDEGMTAAMAALLQTGIDGGCTVRDLAGELFAVLARVLGADGARVTLTEGDDLWLGHLEPELDIGSLPDMPAGQAARNPSLAGLGSVVSTPLLSAGRAWGVIDLYWSVARVSTEREMTTARSFAAIVAHTIAVAAGHERVRITESVSPLAVTIPCERAVAGDGGRSGEVVRLPGLVGWTVQPVLAEELTVVANGSALACERGHQLVAVMAAEDEVESTLELCSQIGLS